MDYVSRDDRRFTGLTGLRMIPMLTLADLHTYEEEIRKSRFIAKAGPVDRPDDTFAFLEKVSEAEATHNCWAFRIGTNYRFSDDGEPKGTVGRPILAAIERQGLDHVMVVVTRYFGGIKLGAGGLTRAYGGVAAACLKNAPRREVLPMTTFAFECAFDLVNPLYRVIDQHAAEKIEETYTNRGVAVTLRLETSRFEGIEKALADLSRGAIRIEILEQT